MPPSWALSMILQILLDLRTLGQTRIARFAEIGVDRVRNRSLEAARDRHICPLQVWAGGEIRQRVTGPNLPRYCGVL